MRQPVHRKQPVLGLYTRGMRAPCIPEPAITLHRRSLCAFQKLPLEKLATVYTLSTNRFAQEHLSGTRNFPFAPRPVPCESCPLDERATFVCYKREFLSNPSIMRSGGPTQGHEPFYLFTRFRWKYQFSNFSILPPLSFSSTVRFFSFSFHRTRSVIHSHACQ